MYLERKIEMTGYTYELVVSVKFLFIPSLIVIQYAYQIFIYFIYLLKPYYIPIDALDSVDIAGRMAHSSALIELTIYIKTAFYRVKVMKNSGDKGLREDGT